MVGQTENQVDFRFQAEVGLHKIREGCKRWAVDAEAQSLRAVLQQASLRLEDIGSSESQLEFYVKSGFKSSALNYFRVFDPGPVKFFPIQGCRLNIFIPL